MRSERPPTAVLLPLVLATALPAAAAGAAPSAQQILDRSIAYHDPSGLWGHASLRLTVAESRQDGTKRRTVLDIDPRSERFKYRTESDAGTVEGSIVGDRCTTRYNGSEEIPDAKRRELRLTCDQVLRRRDYYTYLWGLPMKLRDPGTIVHPEVAVRTFDERELLEVQVTYREDVGTDTWFFYFDPESFALSGYRFYHDRAKGDGEYILLDGEVSEAGLRLPETRVWFTHLEDRYLGTDTLLSIERLDR